MSTKIGPSKTRIIKTSGQNWNGNISYFFKIPTLLLMNCQKKKL